MKSLKYILITILACSVLVLSCKKDSPSPFAINNIFEVTISEKGTDCGLMHIDFKEIDSLRIWSITERKSSLRFEAHNLDKKFNDQIGKRLVVSVRKTHDNELTICKAFGPSYPWVTVLSAEEL